MCLVWRWGCAVLGPPLARLLRHNASGVATRVCWSKYSLRCCGAVSHSRRLSKHSFPALPQLSTTAPWHSLPCIPVQTKFTMDEKAVREVAHASCTAAARAWAWCNPGSMQSYETRYGRVPAGRAPDASTASSARRARRRQRRASCAAQMRAQQALAARAHHLAVAGHNGVPVPAVQGAHCRFIRTCMRRRAHQIRHQALGASL